jgi:hypothetical protein
MPPTATLVVLREVRSWVQVGAFLASPWLLNVFRGLDGDPATDPAAAHWEPAAQGQWVAMRAPTADDVEQLFASAGVDHGDTVLADAATAAAMPAGWNASVRVRITPAPAASEAVRVWMDLWGGGQL